MLNAMQMTPMLWSVGRGRLVTDVPAPAQLAVLPRWMLAPDEPSTVYTTGHLAPRGLAYHPDAVPCPLPDLGALVSRLRRRFGEVPVYLLGDTGPGGWTIAAVYVGPPERGQFLPTSALTGVLGR